MWANDNRRARPNRWEGERPKPHSTKWSQSIACNHRPHIIYVAMLIIWGLSMSAHIGRMARIPAWPRWGWGGGGLANTPTLAKCSHTMLWHTNLPRVPFYIILTRQQAILADHDLCISGRNLACILHKSQVTYMYIHPYGNFNNIIEEHIGPLVKWEKAASTWSTAHFRPLGAAQKGLFFSSCILFNNCHANTSKILACWRTRWHPHGSLLR